MDNIKIIRLCNYWKRSILNSEIQKGVFTMKKIYDYKVSDKSLHPFSGVPAAEKCLYWTGSPWNVFRLLAKTRG